MRLMSQTLKIFRLRWLRLEVCWLGFTEDAGNKNNILSYIVPNGGLKVIYHGRKKNITLHKSKLVFFGKTSGFPHPNRKSWMVPVIPKGSTNLKHTDSNSS